MSTPAPNHIEEVNEFDGPPQHIRHRLPDERASITHHFNIAGHEGYITVGLYRDGQPGEIFIKMSKQGSTFAGLFDMVGMSVSMGLQAGIPLKSFVDKFSHMSFEPSGWSQNDEIRFAKSIADYIGRWLEVRFITGKQQPLFPSAEKAPAVNAVEMKPCPASPPVALDLAA